jgi:hypothetical protein
MAVSLSGHELAGAEERPLLEDGTKQSSEDPENTSLCAKVICKV